MIANDTVLFLTNNDNTMPLLSWLKERCHVIEMREKVTLEYVKAINPALVISFNYRYIIKKDVISFLGKRIINMHISYLPWNKGSNPNFWSFFDKTPKGVTIHQLDEGLDTGDILFQKELFLDEEKETFISSYDKLLAEMIELFKENWEIIRTMQWEAIPQKTEGTYHTMKDMDEIQKVCKINWSDNIAEYLKKYSENVKQ
ncbi:MAG: formyl transferase [Lachnospiraceae bacterium]|nr:formyl transferase [Lachnospiraceae bacterium]